MALDRPPGAGSASRLGNYELLKELSGGGIGSTWLARASSDAEAMGEAPVTILRIYRHLTKKAETADAILREASIAQRIRFPTVLSVLDARTADGEVFIVSEYVEGEQLGALVSAAGAEGLPLPVALRVGVDVLRALVSAHAAEPVPVVHGELNPTHVSLGTDGIARVGGLGVARAIAGLAPMGTRNPDRLAYAAPERVKAMATHTAAPLDPRADLFSAGVILWELLSRQRLFSSKLETAVIQKVQTAPIPSLAGLAGGAVPAQVAEVVRTALERDPALRFESASAMLAALEAAGAGQIAGADDVTATVLRLAGKTIAPRRAMIAAAMASAGGAAEAWPTPPPPRARGMTLVGVALPVPEATPSPRGDGSRHAITAPSPRPRAPAAPAGLQTAAGGAVVASQLRPSSGASAPIRPSSGASAPKDATAPKNGAAARPGAGAGASNGAAPAGAGADHADIDAAWGAEAEAPARLPAARPPTETLPRIGPPSERTESRAAAASPATAAVAPGATAPRSTRTPAEGTAPKRPTPVPRAPLPRPPQRPAPPRAPLPPRSEDPGKSAAAPAAGAAPATPPPSPVTPRAPVAPTSPPATPRAPAPPARAVAAPAAATPHAPPVAAAAAPAPATAHAPATPGPHGSEPSPASSRTALTPTGLQGLTKQWGRAASAVDRLGPGSTLGRYEILMPVAKGGMASVWAARLQGTRGFQKIVAIKTMLPDVSDDPDFESMFLDEARVAARVRHPNVVEILDLGEEDDVLYIVMEWVDGETAGALQRAAKPLGGIPQRLVLRIASQICAGLHNAHELRDDTGALLDLVHRDISPANVLISTAGFVKIVDFGVAKSKGRLHITRAGGVIKGKTPYLSPEQLGGLPIDRRSDIFSLGALLYVLTTGLHPFRAETELSTVENITIKDPLPPRELNGAIHPEFERIILKALEKDRENRFATCAEMQRAIDQVASILGEPTTDEDVAAFVRKAIGETQARRAQELRDAIAAVDAGAAVNSDPRPGLLADGQIAAADAIPASVRGGAPASAKPAPAGVGPVASAAAAASAAGPEEDGPPISFEEIAVPAQPVEAPPRLILAPSVQADLPPEEARAPSSSRPSAREGKLLGASAPRVLPAAGVPPTKVLAAADPPAARAALAARFARSGPRSLANDVGEVTAVDRSYETGQRRKRLQLIVAGAATFCVALLAFALVVRSGDEHAPGLGKSRVEALPATAAPAADTGVVEATTPASPAPVEPPQAAQPPSPPPDETQPSAAPSAEAQQPATSPAEAQQPAASPAEAPQASPAARAPVTAAPRPAATPRPPSTSRARAVSTSTRPAPKPSSTGKATTTTKKKYNPSGI
ncbi:uncharacterized protein SOCEGT47_008550 [Sorangium cellulosum]|uniref:Protein kinase domain-containing protein n=1 Tax=Sorangium cellulosum TaxID=56 RepID=A0A4P2PVC8_SORCE|nr:serine/threonine-protein kinase [Sorangium cellulosum]AUX20386.1 uncharacterized protein SOCEGT47_008550 [Sorangium cellulosum]